MFLIVAATSILLVTPLVTPLRLINTLSKVDRLNRSPIRLRMSTDTDSNLTNENIEVETVMPIPIDETPEQKYKREKLAEIEALKAQEVFVTRNTGKYECQACGYVYDESKGLKSKGVAPNTPFDEIEKFRCPQCGANKKYFVAEQETLSGFKENLKFGLGTNALTGSQKTNLIFGGLFFGFLIFMSGYLLE
eukprot:gene8353-11299_t